MVCSLSAIEFYTSIGNIAEGTFTPALGALCGSSSMRGQASSRTLVSGDVENVERVF